MTYRGKRRSGPWYRDGHERLLFEYGVKSRFPDLTSSMNGNGLKYQLTVGVPHYESRHVTILFRPGYVSPKVSVDGPAESRHRYSDGTLCMWDPADTESYKWVLSDKLPALIGIIIRHLFKEAWWRETGEWLGAEAAHGSKVVDTERVSS